MGYLDQCRVCDVGSHHLCDGTVTVMEQDGPNIYVCRCAHRRATLDRQRIEGAERTVRRLMAELGIDRTHVLTLRQETHRASK